MHARSDTMRLTHHEKHDAAKPAMHAGRTQTRSGAPSPMKRAERLAKLTSELTRRVSLFRLERARFDLDLLKKGLGGPR